MVEKTTIPWSIPRFRIEVADLPLKGDLASLVKGITFTDNVEKFPKVVYHLEDKEILTGSGRARLIDTNTFSQGTDTDIWMGYGDDSKLPYIGHFRITKLEPKFSPTGVNYSVTGHGLEWIFSRSNSKSWLQFGVETIGKTTTDKVIKEVVSEYYSDYDWEFDIKEPPWRTEEFKEADISDLAFFHRMGRRDGYRFWIENKAENILGKFKIKHIVHWQPIAEDRTVATNLYFNSGQKSNLLRFSPKINMKEKGSKISVVAWDSKEGKPIRISYEIVLKGDEFNARRLKKNTQILKFKTLVQWELVPQTAVLQFGGYYIVKVFDAGVTEQRVRDYGERIYKKMKSEWILANGVAIGNPNIRAGKLVEIHNVGTLYSGKYYIFKSMHKMNRNTPYQTSFTARKLVEI